MSRSATVVAGRVADCVQDVDALAEGLPHVGFRLVSAEEVAQEYGVPSNGKNAFWKTYSNRSMSKSEIKARMTAALKGDIDGFNAAYVLRSTDPNANEAALLRGEDGRLTVVCDLYQNGYGLGRRIMSQGLLKQTNGSLHTGDDYPEEAFGRVAQAQKLGRVILDARAKGLEVEPVTVEDETPLFRIRKDAERAVAVSVNDVGVAKLKAEGFRGEGCEAHLNELLATLGLEPEETENLPEYGLSSIEEKVPVVETAH